MKLSIGVKWSVQDYKMSLTIFVFPSGLGDKTLHLVEYFPLYIRYYRTNKLPCIIIIFFFFNKSPLNYGIVNM